MEKYRALGLMSGTSLDGVDIAACEFSLQDGSWSFGLAHSHTYPYPDEWKEKLAGLPGTDALTFSRTHAEYGHFLGKLALSFMAETGFRPHLIASHGHTIFHQPSQGLTVQIGSGPAMAAETGLPVVFDFRSADVALGGQGAPLVPAGDRLLFGQYDACLNLGGFANISMENKGERIAWDICPVNIIMNRIASRIGLEFDKDGLIARSGNPDRELLQQLDSLGYYQLKWPKSLGREWLEMEFLPMTDAFRGPAGDLMRTVCEHIARQVVRSAPPQNPSRILVTGGGAHNSFLIERIREGNFHDWTIPRKEIADFKEALVFAFLGVLRWRGDVNVLRSVTGSRMDHSGGTIALISSAPQY